MYKHLQQDLEQIDHLLSLTKEKAVAYLNNIDEQPTSLPPVETVNAELPAEGVGLASAVDYFYKQHADTIVSSSGPRYWGFVTGGTTPAAIAGDWLTAVFDQNPQTLKGNGDLSANIEIETINLFQQLLGLPQTFNGGFVTGATMANFTGLAVGRQWAGLQKNNNIAREGIKTDIKVFSAVPHSSAIKSLAMLGMGSNNIIVIKTIEGNREAIDCNDLEDKLKEFINHPKILISSGGTVNSVDFDDMKAIAKLQQQFLFYWHVDAAFGGFAACSKKYQHLIDGWQSADSIAIDCHKWMNVPYDSAVYFVQKKHAPLQVQTFQNSNAPYLGNPEENFSYLNFGPENSRRLRALPAWFSLMAYGRQGFEWIVENNIFLASDFGRRIEEETIFTLAAPVRLNVVCFTTKEEYQRKEILASTLARLNKNAKVFITPTVYNGLPCLRAAFVNWRTQEKDIAIAIKELQDL
jgi:glutamate/tyrosine decarboxylase-like PLP-dependent enzyme